MTPPPPAGAVLDEIEADHSRNAASVPVFTPRENDLPQYNAEFIVYARKVVLLFSVRGRARGTGSKPNRILSKRSLRLPNWLCQQYLPATTSRQR
jgi:hypothetical protein